MWEFPYLTSFQASTITENYHGEFPILAQHWPQISLILKKINNSCLEAVTESLCIEWVSAIFKTFFKVFI